MRKFILIIFFILNFQTLTTADDIKDFEIEGMSIGDSLLNFMKEDEIISLKRNYFEDKRKYYVVGFADNSNTYDSLDIYLLSDDKNYIIKSIIGFKFMDMDACLKEKDGAINDIEELFKNTKKHEHPNAKHEYDKTGNSVENQTAFLLDGDLLGSYVSISCMDWSDKLTKEKNWTDNFGISATSREVNEWIASGYK